MLEIIKYYYDYGTPMQQILLFFYLVCLTLFILLFIKIVFMAIKNKFITSKS